MPRITASVSDDEYSHVEAVSEEVDVSLAEVLRRLINAHRRGDAGSDALVPHPPENDAQSDALDDALDRIDDLEARVADLEASNPTPEPPEPVPEETRKPAGDVVTYSGDADAAELDGLLERWPARSETKREARREAGRASLEYLRDRGEARAKDFRDDVEPDHPVGGQSPDTWWVKSSRPALKRAQEAGIVEYAEGHKLWRWGGES